ncbi:NIPSNAP family protein [Candidatus Poriferisodalis sp.]|uniref:NIPSNAP family protein n=1 Tax=Candidatus Poriferisodalis sp. TaxID=3101277 RepID=UPI003B5B9C35
MRHVEGDSHEFCGDAALPAEGGRTRPLGQGVLREGLRGTAQVPRRAGRYYTTEFGGINEIIHMWRYDSLEERAQKRKALFEDAQWLEFVKEIAPLVETQENAILRDIFET